MKSTETYSRELSEKWGLTLTSEYTGAHRKVSFKCINGHLNEAAATNLLQRGYKCKECIEGRKIVPKLTWSDALVDKMLELLKTNTTENTAVLLNTTVSSINNQLAKLGISNPRERLSYLNLLEALRLQERTLVSDFLGSKCLVTVKCSKGHTVTQQASNIIAHNTNCPQCFSLGVSSGEKDLVNYIESIYSGWVEVKDRSILNGKELDIVLPDLGIAIEYNGTYWHREDKVGTTYHMNKTNQVEQFGYQLLHIKDYDWVNNKDIIKSMLMAKLGVLGSKVYARHCSIKHIDFPVDFLNRNHIQGAGQPTNINYGLFNNDTLVAVATFAKPRYDKDANLELIRYCSLVNNRVVGGLSKLLKQVAGNRVVTYAARDYSNGKAYLSVGFKLTRTTSPGLEYYSRHTKLSRYKAQSMTPEELSGYTKYYNSGNLVFHKDC